MWCLVQALAAYFLALGSGIVIGWGGDLAWLSIPLGIVSGVLLGNLAGRAEEI